MTFNNSLYRKLRGGGLGHRAALLMANTDTDNVECVDVTDPAALTAPANIAASYTEAEVQAIRDDVAALRGTVAALVTSLRNGGVIG